MKRVGLFLGILLVLSVLQFAFVLAESGSGSDGSDSGSAKDDDDEDSDEEVESETEVEIEDGRVKIEEKTRIGGVKREIKTEIRDGKIREEIKEENGEFKRELRQEIRTILAEEREKEIIEFRMKIKANNGIFKVENRTFMVKELTEEDKEIVAGRINAKTGLNLSAGDIGNGSRGSILRAYLSNGQYAQIRILPDRAAEVAAERLRIRCEERNCTVVLKEVGFGNKSEARYEIESEKEARTLGVFRTRMKVQAHIDPDSGEVILIKKPWWAFLANEDEDAELDEVEDDGNETESEDESEDENETEVEIEANTSVLAAV